MTPLPAPAEDLALLAGAAREAGKIATRFWRKQPKAWDKDAGAGPVTEADIAVDAHLRERLLAARPAYGWLSEESEDEPSRLDARRTFILDPIDGTRAFIEGHQGFSHAIAVAEGDRIIAGVVYLPVPDLLYAAAADGPATLNGGPLVPSVPALDGARVLTAKSNLDPGFWRGRTVPPIKREFRPSLAWRLCLVAEGRFDAVLSLRSAWEWDIAAGALIAERAGCTVTDMHGRRMRFNRPLPAVDGLLIAPPALHEALSARLAPPAAA
ncbi:3'(2'),5'-bisphosphate nucleotidase CysQ [Paracoccus sp. S-4012]|uniref:3'(2'),5'-bisphosphate nucleotidase CysQ n=1 Tax=Paracoccus sp. S-4012 TaxID=2665648 RepID=UPI00351B8077